MSDFVYLIVALHKTTFLICPKMLTNPFVDASHTSSLLLQYDI